MQYCILRWCRNFKYKRTETTKKRLILYTIFIFSMCMFKLTNCQIERNFKVVVRLSGWGELNRKTFFFILCVLLLVSFTKKHNRNWICLQWLFFKKKKKCGLSMWLFESMSNNGNIRWNASILVRRNYSLCIVCTSYDIYVYQHIFSYTRILYKICYMIYYVSGNLFDFKGMELVVRKLRLDLYELNLHIELCARSEAKLWRWVVIQESLLSSTDYLEHSLVRFLQWNFQNRLHWFARNCQNYQIQNFGQMKRISSSFV